MRARDQSSIFSTGGKFRPDCGLLLELHALTLSRPFLCALVDTYSAWADYVNCSVSGIAFLNFESTVVVRCRWFWLEKDEFEHA